MRIVVRTLAGCAVVLLGIARLTGCVGDDSNRPPDFVGLDADLPDRDLGPDPDATEDSSVVVVDPPSYCDGIVFYASLDNTFVPERSGATGLPHGNAKLVASGKFGGSTSLFEDGGQGDGAAVYYYTPPDGGVPWYPDKVGTVSLWYRGAALDENGSPVLWRVTGSIPPAPVLGGGLTLLNYQDELGLFASVGTTVP